MTTLIKLGGSLITDKNIPQSFREDTVKRLAFDIRQILECKPQEKFIIGHGSGSFGHVEAQKYNTINGVKTPEDWFGFSSVAHSASELSQLVLQQFIQAHIASIRLQPSASVVANDGIIKSMDINTINRALQNNVIPIIHGDVAFDTRRGGTIISTETIFSYLVKKLNISKIILLGEVDGVLDKNETVIESISPQSIGEIKSVLKGSSGVDVTGGMYQKVIDMLELVKIKPDLEIVIANGKRDHILVDIVCKDYYLGTKIRNINLNI